MHRIRDRKLNYFIIQLVVLVDCCVSVKPSHSFRRWFQLDCSLNFYFSRVKLHDILRNLKVISFSAARQNRLSWKAVNADFEGEMT